MGLKAIPGSVRERYQIEERGHATAILSADFSDEFNDIVDCLRGFRLKRSHILTPGGGKSPISAGIDAFLQGRGWTEKSFDIKITVDGEAVPVPTHKIESFKDRIGDEVEG